MKERHRNALIGLFVVAGMVCGGLLLVLFGESQGLFQRQYIVRAKFEGSRTPPSIRKGTEVSLAGVWVGNVSAVSLVDPAFPSKGLVAEMSIEDGFRVPKGSVAQVVMPLMGQATVNIVPPAAPTEESTDELRGEVMGPLDNILDPKLMGTIEATTEQIRLLAAALTPAANAVTDLLERRPIDEVESPEAKIKGITANLATAIQRLYNVLTHFDTVLGDPAVQSNVKVTLENFRVASEGVKLATADLQQFSAQAKEIATMARGTMGRVDETVVITKGHIDTLGKKLTTDADKLSRILDYFVTIGQSVAEGQGTAAMLLNDPKLYDELLLTFRRLGEAAAEMQTLIKEWQAGGIGFRMR